MQDWWANGRQIWRSLPERLAEFSQSWKDESSDFQQEFFATTRLLKQFSKEGDILQCDQSASSSGDHHVQELDPRTARFLDLLAKVFALDVDNVHNGCAALLVRTNINFRPRVLVARTQGFTSKDDVLVSKLEAWMRDVAHHDDPDKHGILDALHYHNRAALEKSMVAISENDPAALNALCLTNDAYNAMNPLYERCRTLAGPMKRSYKLGHEVLSLADRIAPFLRTTNLTQQDVLIHKHMRILATLPLAYHTFYAMAARTYKFQDMEIKAVDHTHKLGFYPSVITPRIARINTELGKLIPRSKLNNKKIGWYKTYCHAELQILHHVENTENAGIPNMYVGTSHAPCFLCHTFVTNYESRFDVPYQIRDSSPYPPVKVNTRWNSGIMLVTEGTPAQRCLSEVRDAMRRILGQRVSLNGTGIGEVGDGNRDEPLPNVGHGYVRWVAGGAMETGKEKGRKVVEWGKEVVERFKDG